jgi:hypothetical protein
MRFHETNDISRIFSGKTLGFCEVAKYFVDFQFRFRYFQKMTGKFQFHSNRFEIFEVSNLAMAKVKKVNIAVTHKRFIRLADNQFKNLKMYFSLTCFHGLDSVLSTLLLSSASLASASSISMRQKRQKHSRQFETVKAATQK